MISRRFEQVSFCYRHFGREAGSFGGFVGSKSGYAGLEGIEPPIAVLETAVIPFNYSPRTLLIIP